jgi:hypothetical protein
MRPPGKLRKGAAKPVPRSEQIEQPDLEEVAAVLKKMGYEVMVVEANEESLQAVCDKLRPFPEKTVLFVKSDDGQYCLIGPTELEKELGKIL